jgi:hypothetical protein
MRRWELKTTNSSGSPMKQFDFRIFDSVQEMAEAAECETESDRYDSPESQLRSFANLHPLLGADSAGS